MIWNLCIRRPVLTIVAFLIIAIFGMYAYYQMPVRENPDVEFPIVSVNVVLPGAEPEVVETEIIEPLEELVNTIEGLKNLKSTAREQVGIITAEFELWRDIDVAAQDVRDRVARARRDLPDDIEAPIVRKIDPDAQPIMWIALTGDERWNAVELSQYADETLKERLENLRGVGQILIGGQQLYAVRLRLDPARLAAHHLTVGDVVRTVQTNNVKIPSGRVESREREFLVKTLGQFAEAEPLNRLIITEEDGFPVRIGDVGQAVDGVEDPRQLARFNAQTTVGLGVVKQRDANTVALAESVRNRIEQLSKEFPPGLEYILSMDNSEYIEENINDLIFTIFIATLLVMLVVFGFLRSLRGTAITSLAMPTSLLGGLALAYVFGFTLNVLTLLGLILAIGIVIDDAIVVLESSYRRMEEGDERREAVRTGTKLVAFPNIANTLSLAAVFIPVAFTSGIIGRFFFEFSLTIAATVFASTFTALTLTPMLCSRFLKIPEHRGKLLAWSENVFTGVEEIYRRLLATCINHRAITILSGVALFAAGIWCFTELPKEFLPTVDRAEFMVSFETPEGSTIRYTDDYARRIEQVLSDTPEVESYFLAIGLSQTGGPGRVNRGMSFVRLTHRTKRERRQVDIMQSLRERLAKIPGGNAYVTEIGVISIAGAPLQIVLQHPNLMELARRQETIMTWMRSEPDYVGVDSDLKMNKPQINVSIYRDKASQMGITVAAISNTMRYLLGELEISEIERESERYEIIPEVVTKGEMTPDALRRLYVRNNANRLVSLGNVVDLEETIGPSEINHYNRLRSATISASNPPGVALGDALSKLEGYLEETLPGTFDYEVAGRAETFRESFYYLTIALLFSVVFVYLVLAAQFESFIHPFTIMLTLPLASVGAFGALWALGMTFNIFSFIGLIMLTGMATKNAILLIDYTNVLVRDEKDPVQAAKEAAHIRFRPVIMTTVSTVLGLMPIALGYGAGGESRAPLGVAVASGLTVTTGLTLLVIPVVYTVLQTLQQKITTWIRK